MSWSSWESPSDRPKSSSRNTESAKQLLIGQVADDAIAKVPAVVQKQVAREKAQQHLSRQRALTQRGAGTPQELEDAETDWKTAAANYDDAVQSARTVIANAIASKVSLSQAGQTLIDMTIRAPTPKLIPPSLKRTSVLSYGITKRQVSEGQMIKEGEAIAELVIEDPIRLWSQVPEQYAEDVQLGQRVRLTTRAHPGVAIEGKIARINPSVETASRTFQVETVVPNERGLLRPGGFAKASIIVDAESKAAVVPTESIVRFAGVTKLFIVENGKARSINDIQTGTEGRGWVEVTSKLLPDIRSDRHHGPNPTCRRNARRDSRARAHRRAQARAKPAQFPRPPRPPAPPRDASARSKPGRYERDRQDLLPFLVSIPAFP